MCEGMNSETQAISARNDTPSTCENMMRHLCVILSCTRCRCRSCIVLVGHGLQKYAWQCACVLGSWPRQAMMCLALGAIMPKANLHSSVPMSSGSSSPLSLSSVHKIRIAAIREAPKMSAPRNSSLWGRLCVSWLFKPETALTHSIHLHSTPRTSFRFMALYGSTSTTLGQKLRMGWRSGWQSILEHSNLMKQMVTHHTPGPRTPEEMSKWVVVRGFFDMAKKPSLQGLG